MPVRSVLLMLATGVVLGLAVAASGQPARPTIHRNGFAGKDVFFRKGDGNIRFDERDHKVSAEHHKSAATSEYIKIEATPPPGSPDAEFVHYYYECPPAPLVERMTARVFVKAYRAGVQVKARVVLPRERDPKTPDAALTVLIAGDVYDKVRQWQGLSFGDPAEVLKKQMPILRARLGREVDPADAYIDRIVLNVYAGPGVTEVWVDDLEVGPIRADARAAERPAVGKDAPGLPAGKAKTKAVSVEASGGQILVDGDPFFFLGIRHSDAPLKTLRDAGFNTVFFPNDATPEMIEEAVRNGFWIVPTLPLPAGGWDGTKPKKPDDAQVEKDADAVAKYLRKFLSGDAVLMWDFGGGRTVEDLPRVIRATEVVRTYDPRRPRSVDLWDGFQPYSRYVNAVGAHRWPLFSSLELASYRDWLAQRQLLIPPGKLFWTWVQTHLPDWYLEQVYGRADVTAFADPIGPHPEQIRILTYLSLAAGCRGLGFWSDKFLSKDTHHGKDRLLEIALLNAEIRMLEPVLAKATDPAQFVGTSDPNVQAAIVASVGDILVLPVWMGFGTQYVPPQGVVADLRVTVPRVPDGAKAWRITPAGIEPMIPVSRGPGGVVLSIPDFDLTAAIVITTDLGPTGKVVRWQDDTRFRMGKTAAEWALLLAGESYQKTVYMHGKILAAGGPVVPEADELLATARESMTCAREFIDNKQWDSAYREARRALRPLRLLMRTDWDMAVRSLDFPTASPYAVSFYSLPQHWELEKEVRAARPGGTGLAHGGFELSKPAPATGAAIDSLPGWKERKTILDPVDGVASVINSDTLGVPDTPPKPPIYSTARDSPLRVAPQPIVFRQPQCGQHVLQLRMTQRKKTEADGRETPPVEALERAILAVDSPAAVFAPGSLVRISFWVKTAGGIGATADGLVVFDSAGGEPLGFRTRQEDAWKQIRLYRRVPASGKVFLTIALTGLGTAWVDDIQIEPLIPGGPPVAVGGNYSPGGRPDPSTAAPLGAPKELPPRLPGGTVPLVPPPGGGRR